MADQNAYLGSFILNIRPAPRGTVTVDIIFEIDKSGIVNVTAIDETTGNKKSITLDSPNKMSEYEVNKAIKEFKANAIKDETDEILQQLKNEAYDIIDDAKNVVANSSIGYAEKTNIDNLIKSLEEAIETDSKAKIPIVSTRLRNTLLDLIG